MAIISLTGKLQSGKDLTGKIIKCLTANYSNNEILDAITKKGDYELLPFLDESNWEIKKFAAKVKQVASLILGVPVEKFEDNEYKNSYLGPEWDYIKMSDGWVPTYMNPDNRNLEKPAEPIHNRMTVREFLQRIGTDAMRVGLHENTWVNALFADYKHPHFMYGNTPYVLQKDGGYQPADINHNGMHKTDMERLGATYHEMNWIITDTRFPNELDAIKKHNGIRVKVHRPVDLRLPELNAQWPNAPLLTEPDDTDFLDWLLEANPEEFKKHGHVSELIWNNLEFDYTLVNDCDLDEYIERVIEMLQHFKIIN